MGQAPSARRLNLTSSQPAAYRTASPACPCFARWPGGGAPRAPAQRTRKSSRKAGRLMY